MPAFKHGVSEHSNGGYPRMSCGPQRHTFVHILIAEAMLGRKLRADEHVHHKDGDTKNPHWSNLLVLDETTHNAVSNRQYWYLKQRLSKEEASWRAYFDVTGKTYDETEKEEKRSSEVATVRAVYEYMGNTQ
jgi:HNH endonuclease